MKIRKWLIPGKHNRFHPHVLRPIGLFILVIALLTINITYNFTTAKKIQVLGYATNISASEVIRLSNIQRANAGLPALSSNSQLTQAAQAKAQDMFADGYWAHNNPDGKTPWYFIGNAGYSYSIAGENLAKDFSTSNGVVNAWMNSSGHRANIVNSSFKHTGVAAVNGTFNGEQTTIVVAMYAAPKAAPAPAPAPKPAPEPAPTPTPTTTTRQSSPAPEPRVVAQAPAEEPEPEPKPVETAPTTKEDEEESVNAVAVTNNNTQTPIGFSPEQVNAQESRNWAQNATFFLLSTIFLITVIKHTVVWRTQKRGWRHIWLRAHPAAQYGLILLALIANVVGATGVIV